MALHPALEGGEGEDQQQGSQGHGQQGQQDRQQGQQKGGGTHGALDNGLANEQEVTTPQILNTLL